MRVGRVKIYRGKMSKVARLNLDNQLLHQPKLRGRLLHAWKKF
jgi:hypothetical protein